MVTLVPRAQSASGRILHRIGRLLGLRSETVYSRTILLVALVQFIVLGLAVVAVWLAVTAQFRRADQEELLAAARRVEAYFASQPGVAPGVVASRASALIGRPVYLQSGGSDGAARDLRIVFNRAGKAPDAAFRLRSGEEVVVAGAFSFYDAGLDAARIFVVCLALAGGLMLLVMLFVVDRTIVGRIQLLNEKVEREKSAEQLPVKLDYPGDDELAMLAHSIEELALLVQEAEREYRRVVEDQMESICRFDRDWHITYSNRAFSDLCALPPGGRKPALEACLAPEVYRALRETVSSLNAGKSTTVFTQQIGKPDGLALWYRSTLRANFDAAGSLLSGQWIAADITSEVTAQRRLQDSQKQLAGLSARLMTLQDEERRRLARELHDSTSQSLAALEINMSALEKTADPAEAKRLAAESGEISRQVVDQLRTISYLLHPPLLDEAGLGFAIRWLADGFTKRNNIPVFVDIPDIFPRLSPETETALFRVVQESLSNIYRHAGATKAWITLGGDEAGIHLEVRDNGQGLPANFSLERSGGVGLAGMRERMRELGGSLELMSSEYGVLVKCRLQKSDESQA